MEAGFTVVGGFQGKKVFIHCEDGNVSGDERAVDTISILAFELEGQPLGVGERGYSVPNHLQHPTASIIFIASVLLRWRFPQSQCVPRAGGIPPTMGYVRAVGNKTQSSRRQISPR
jgi:hypothetical protein